MPVWNDLVDPLQVQDIRLVCEVHQILHKLTVSMKQRYFKTKCSKCYKDAVKLWFCFWLNLVCQMHCFTYSAAIRSDFFSVSTTTTWDPGGHYKHYIFCVSLSFGIRWVPANPHRSCVFAICLYVCHPQIFLPCFYLFLFY